MAACSARSGISNCTRLSAISACKEYCKLYQALLYVTGANTASWDAGQHGQMTDSTNAAFCMFIYLGSY